MINHSIIAIDTSKAFNCMPSTPKHFFFALGQPVTITDSIQYLEGSNGIWKDYDRSFQIQFGIEEPKIVLGSTFFLGCVGISI